MSLTATLQATAFSEFLFADIADEPNGMTLSLISALSRLGVDPWAEAARLADMPEALAVAALAALLARALEAAQAAAHADTRTLAQRLVAKLPRGNAVQTSGAPRRVGLIGFLAGHGRLSGDSARWWGVAIALAVMLVTTFLF